MKERKVLVDVDGVLLYWNVAFTQYMNKLGYEEVYGAKEKYSLAHRYNFPRKEMDELVEQFNTSDHMLSLEPLDGAVKYVSQLVDHGFTFVAITSLSDNKQAKEKRIKNLENVFGGGVFTDVICLPMGSGKYHALEPWENTGLYWIEDKFSNALEGAGLGLNSLLITYPYNVGFESNRITRIPEDNPWKHIFDIIKEDYEL